METAIERDLRIELARPAAMDAALTAFVEKVYANAQIMSAPDRVQKYIYRLYMRGEGGHVAAPNRQEMLAFLTNLKGAVAQYPELGGAKTQKTKTALNDVVTLGASEGAGDKVRFVELCSEFIYLTVRAGAGACRVYANVKAAKIPDFVREIGKYVRSGPNHGIRDFKIAGPAVIAARADTVVMYCESGEFAVHIATELADKLGAPYFNAPVPAITQRIRPGIGVAIGAEPARQATGLGTQHRPWEENIQSFGMIRTEAIAGAVYNFHANKDLYGDRVDVFKRFVAVAFRGVGINPERSAE